MKLEDLKSSNIVIFLIEGIKMSDIETSECSLDIAKKYPKLKNGL